MKLIIRDKISNHYLIQGNFPEIEKKKYYTFENYNRKAINAIVEKHKSKYVEGMQQRTIAENFPQAMLRALIKKRIRIGTFEAIDLDKQAGRVNMYRMRMEMQKKSIMEMKMEAGMVKQQMREIKKRCGKQIYGITQEGKKCTGKEADPIVMEYFAKLLYENQEKRREITGNIAKEEVIKFFIIMFG